MMAFYILNIEFIKRKFLYFFFKKLFFSSDLLITIAFFLSLPASFPALGESTLCFYKAKDTSS